MQDTLALSKSASGDSCATDTDPVLKCQAVKMLHEEVGSQPEGTCGDMLVLPIYAALPPELQVRPPCCSSSPSMCNTLTVNKKMCCKCQWQYKTIRLGVPGTTIHDHMHRYRTLLASILIL